VTPRGLTGAAALLASAALVLSAGRPASGYAEAAPAGFSGGFGEASCHGCHFDAEPNAGAGRLTIAGVPERYTPGARYPVTVTLSRPGMKLGGFQLTARFKADGAQAGSLAVEGTERERVRIDVQSDVQYANQRREGTSLASSGTAAWTLIWTAPLTARGAGPVVFHVAANAANGDETAEGDYVHTAAMESAPGRHLAPGPVETAACVTLLPYGSDTHDQAAEGPRRMAGTHGGRNRPVPGPDRSPAVGTGAGRRLGTSVHAAGRQRQGTEGPLDP
jgi:hypothetical protein